MGGLFQRVTVELSSERFIYRGTVELNSESFISERHSGAEEIPPQPHGGAGECASCSAQKRVGAAVLW